MNTTFKTLENLINNAIDMHHKATLLYSSLASRTDDERCKLLLDDMAEKEMKMAKLLAEFARRAPPAVLNTYMQYTLEENPREVIHAAAPEGTFTVEQIGKLGQTLHCYQIDLMEGAMREVGSREALELLENLLQLEKAEGRAFTRRADSMYDM